MSNTTVFLHSFQLVTVHGEDTRFKKSLLIARAFKRYSGDRPLFTNCGSYVCLESFEERKRKVSDCWSLPHSPRSITFCECILLNSMGWLRRDARGRQEARATKRFLSRAATGQLLTRFFLPICSSPPNAAAMATCSYPSRQLAAPHLRSCTRFQWLSTHENEGELLSNELDFVVVGWNRNSLTPLLFQLARRTLTRVEPGCRIGCCCMLAVEFVLGVSLIQSCVHFLYCMEY